MVSCFLQYLPLTSDVYYASALLKFHRFVYLSMRCPLARRSIEWPIEMPSVTISTAQVRALLLSDQKQASVTTPMGNMMLEIQGDLEIPSSAHADERFSEYEASSIVRFGLLHLNMEAKSATLFIGKKQRLLGSVVKLETPLGLLKFNHDTGGVEMQDIFTYKVIFKNRPLPIM